MFTYEESYPSYEDYEEDAKTEYTTISNSMACARIIVDLAHDAKKAMKMNSKVMVKIKIEDMLLRTVGMIDYSEIDDRAEDMIETICDTLDVSVKSIISCIRDYYSGKLQDLVEELITHRFDTIQTMLDDLLYHEEFVKENFGKYEYFGQKK